MMQFCVVLSRDEKREEERGRTLAGSEDLKWTCDDCQVEQGRNACFEDYRTYLSEGMNRVGKEKRRSDVRKGTAQSIAVGSVMFTTAWDMGQKVCP